MNSEHITRLIYEYNPQRRGGEITVPKFKREIYPEIEKWLEKKQAISIVGLRRTGKTVIMRQMMQGKAQGSGFFSFDEQETQNKETLMYVIDFMVSNFKARYLFLDEVHYVKDWEGVLKRYYDQGGVKFIISGSESLDIRKAKSAMGGRLVAFKIAPFGFREYLALKGEPVVMDHVSLNDHDGLETAYRTLMTKKELFEHELLEYTCKGAFPELIEEADQSVIRKYIRDLIVEKIIFRDIPAIFDIRRRQLLQDLFTYICENSAQLYDVQKLCNLFQADNETVTNYLFYLNSAFLIHSASTFSRSAAKRQRRNKKIYVVHPCMAFAVLDYTREMLIDRVLGHYIETLFSSNYFFRDKKKNEVDVVLSTDPICPIEVKFQNELTNSDLKGLLSFMDDFAVKRGLLATKGTFARQNIGEKEILSLPAWMLLLAYPNL